MTLPKQPPRAPPNNTRTLVVKDINHTFMVGQRFSSRALLRLSFDYMCYRLALNNSLYKRNSNPTRVQLQARDANNKLRFTCTALTYKNKDNNSNKKTNKKHNNGWIVTKGVTKKEELAFTGLITSKTPRPIAMKPMVIKKGFPAIRRSFQTKRQDKFDKLVHVLANIFPATSHDILVKKAKDIRGGNTNRTKS